jgi:hypothetical protein
MYQSDQMRPLRGFDRLAAAGFSAEDIENIRNTFHARQPGYALSGALDAEAGKIYIILPQWNIQLILVSKRTSMLAPLRSNGSTALTATLPTLIPQELSQQRDQVPLFSDSCAGSSSHYSHFSFFKTPCHHTHGRMAHRCTSNRPSSSRT